MYPISTPSYDHILWRPQVRQKTSVFLADLWSSWSAYSLCWSSFQCLLVGGHESALRWNNNSETNEWIAWKAGRCVPRTTVATVCLARVISCDRRRPSSIPLPCSETAHVAVRWLSAPCNHAHNASQLVDSVCVHSIDCHPHNNTLATSVVKRAAVFVCQA